MARGSTDIHPIKETALARFVTRLWFTGWLITAAALLSANLNTTYHDYTKLSSILPSPCGSGTPQKTNGTLTQVESIQNNLLSL